MTSSVPASDVMQMVANIKEQNGLAAGVSPEVQRALYRITLVLSDVVATLFAFGIAFWIRFDLQLPIFQLDASPSRSFYVQVVLVLLPFWLLMHYISGLYDPAKLLGGTEEYASLFRSVTTGFLLITVGGFLAELVIARGWLLLAWAFTFLFSAIGRFLLRRIVYLLRRRGFFLAPAIIVGANPEGQSLAQQLLTWETSGLQVFGFLDQELETGSEVTAGIRVLGKYDHLEKIVDELAIEELILASSALSRDQMLHIFKQFGFSSDINLRLSSGLFEIITTGLSVKEFAYAPLVGVNKVRLTGVDRLLKTALDYAITVPGLILISPMLFVIGVVIKLDSPGPVFHRRRVLGVNGNQFDALKFRTMYVDGDEILSEFPDLRLELEQNHKLRDDPRVTRVGRILRRFSLDELPQLFNVLARQMSLVGPRMISPEEMPKYNQWGLNLLTVPPGITGIWQVSGRSDVSYVDRVRLDMNYVRNWTIWLDMQILLQTIPAVLRGRGAY